MMADNRRSSRRQILSVFAVRTVRFLSPLFHFTDVLRIFLKAEDKGLRHCLDKLLHDA
jgi:hypothetical protein